MLGQRLWWGAGAAAGLAVGLAGYSTGGGGLAALGDQLFQALGTDVVGFALPVAYSRWTVPASASEPLLCRVALSLTLGALALVSLRSHQAGTTDDFAVLFAAQVASYIVFLPCFQSRVSAVAAAALGATTVAAVVRWGFVMHASRFLVGVGAAWFVNALGRRLTGRLPLAARAACLLGVVVAGTTWLPGLLLAIGERLLPISELQTAYETVASFVGAERLQRSTSELMVVTANVQIALGFLGIAFLKAAQHRKNALLAVGVAEHGSSARGFALHAAGYILAVALPYMLQRTAMENVNSYAMRLYASQVELSLRIDSLFPTGEAVQGSLLGAVAGSNFTVEAYADSLSTVVENSYSLVERKLFSLPKLVLLPSMLASQPLLVMVVLPASIVLDLARAEMMGKLSKQIEAFYREIQELTNRRRRMEQHDTKNAELIQRGGSGSITQAQWRALAEKLKVKEMRADALRLFRSFIDALYYQDFVSPGIECAIAFLLEFKFIMAAEIWVYTRVVEDAIDLLLTRFRKQSMLANLETHLHRLHDLSGRLLETQGGSRPMCEVDGAGRELRIPELGYRRGPSVEVRLRGLSLQAGRVYAVTGANGVGKSSFFALLASCGRRAPILPGGLALLPAASPLTLPSDHVVEITQLLYCPLYVKPIAWLLQRPDADQLPESELSAQVQRIVQISAELRFRSAAEDAAGSQGQGLTTQELRSEQDDWYGKLSGGQRCKVEFIRQVFLQESCPGVLLIDEAFGPLDPWSKSAIQTRLKEFCKDSLILVIHHMDAAESCVPPGGFFDGSLHFENGTAKLLGLCGT